MRLLKNFKPLECTLSFQRNKSITDSIVCRLNKMLNYLIGAFHSDKLFNETKVHDLS